MITSGFGLLTTSHASPRLTDELVLSYNETILNNFPQTKGTSQNIMDLSTTRNPNYPATPQNQILSQNKPVHLKSGKSL